MRRLIIVGCGGFGREVADVVTAINAVASSFELLGFADDNPSREDLERLERLGAPYLGTCDDVLASPPSEFVIGIGNGTVRRLLDQQFLDAGWVAATLMHPQASIGANVVLGPGTVVCAGARLTTNIRLGRHVHVNLNSTIGHDCNVDDYASINPLVAVSGNVTIGSGAMLGTHSAILQNVTIGPDATVGGAALVVRDVPERTVVKGVPAR